MVNGGGDADVAAIGGVNARRAHTHTNIRPIKLLADKRTHRRTDRQTSPFAVHLLTNKHTDNPAKVYSSV